MSDYDTSYNPAPPIAVSPTDPSALRARWKLGISKALEGWAGYYRVSFVEQVNCAEDFWSRFNELQSKLPSDDSASDMINIFNIIKQAACTLDEYNKAALESFDRWILWGSILAAADAAIVTGSASTFNWFAEALESMISPLKAFVEHVLPNATAEKSEEMAVQVHVSIAVFAIVVTKQFERGPPKTKMTPGDWKELDLERSRASSQIQNAAQSVEIFIRKTQEYAAKQTLLSRQITLALDTTENSDEAVVPCISLPRASDSRFFDRTDIFEQIDNRLQRFKPEREFCSLALHGLGGVGKSEIALQYAHSRSKEYDAVLWVLSETPNSLETSFTDLCSKLKLKGLAERDHAINKIVLKTWLQKTSKKWLMIFDNAWSQELLREYWPVANRGAVLVTTRNRSISFSPASSEIQVEVFNPVLGSQLLFSVLRKTAKEEDVEAAQALAHSTGGLPLALFNVAGLIQSKNFSISRVVQLYEKHRYQVHRMSQDGRTIDTIWQLSFQHLSEPSADLLGILSLLAPDAIPTLLFQLSEEVDVAPYLQFVKDEWTFENDVLGSLIEHHLVKRESDNQHVAVHRLVQFEFISYSTAAKIQDAFDAASMLLFYAFPRQVDEDAMQSRWSLCSAYSPHVLSIMNFFKQSQTRTDKAHSSQRIVPLRPTAYFIRVLTNCAWHLIETARYERSLEVLQVCLDAWNVFEDKDVDPTIYTHICNHMGVANHWSGNFDQSIRFYEKVYEIYHQIFPVGHYERGNILCNLGNLNLSLGNPEAALEYHLEAKTSFKIGQSADAEIGDQAIISTGRTKCYLDLGRLKEARETVNLSISLCTQRGYLLSRAHSIRLLGDIEFAEGNLGEAKKCYEQSKSLLLNEMGSKTHQMLGAAYIRLGCLAQMEGDHTKAISWFRDALKLADFNTFCRGYRARSLYMLSQALQAMPEPQSESIRAEGLSKMHEAKTLLRQILGDRFREELCDNPVTFDNLVVVHVR